MGRKKWMVSDQSGLNLSIKAQQVTYVVPGTEESQPAQIADFLLKAKDLLDPSLLECTLGRIFRKREKGQMRKN